MARRWHTHRNTRPAAPRRARLQRWERLERRCVLAAAAAGVGAADADADGAPFEIAAPVIAARSESPAPAIAGLDILIDVERQSFRGGGVAAQYGSATLDSLAMPSIDVVQWDDDTRVVVWSNADSAESGIYAQHLQLDGAPLSPPQRIATVSIGESVPVRATALRGGGWVVVWADTGGLHAARFDSPAATSGAEALVHTSPSADTQGFDVVATLDGGFSVVWSDAVASELFTRSYNDQATATGEAEVLIATVGAQITDVQAVAHPLVDYGIVWTEFDSRNDSTVHKYADVLAGGVVQSYELSAVQSSNAPSVAATPWGDVIAVYTEVAAGVERIKLASWAPNGGLLGADVVASTTGVFSVAPRIGVTVEGGLSLAYAVEQSGLTQLYVQLFNQHRQAIGSPQLVNADPAQQIPFLETQGGADWSSSLAWVAFDATTANVHIVSAAQRAPHLGLQLELLEAPIGAPEPVLKVRGLEAYALGAGTPDGLGNWLITDVHEGVVAIFADEDPGVLEVGLDLHPPGDWENPLHQDDFLIGTENDDRLEISSGVKVVRGGKGVDIVVPAGLRHEFQFQSVAGGAVVFAGGAPAYWLKQVELVRFDDILLPLSSLAADAVALAADSFVGAEDQTLFTGAASVLDNDAVGALPRQAYVVESVGAGTLQFHADGSLTFEPPIHGSGEFEFQYDTRLAFWANAFAGDEGNLLSDSQFGLPSLSLETLPAMLQDDRTYRIELELGSVSAVDGDLVLQLSTGETLRPNETPLSSLNAAAGQRLTFDFVKSPAAAGLEFAVIPGGPAPAAQFEIVEIRLLDPSTLDIYAQSRVIDAQPRRVALEIAPVADSPYLHAVAGFDEQLGGSLLTIQSHLFDTDGSESLRLELLGLPPGATVTDGQNAATAATVGDKVDVTAWDWDRLWLQSADESLPEAVVQVVATAAEQANGDSAFAVDAVTLLAVVVGEEFGPSLPPPPPPIVPPPIVPAPIVPAPIVPTPPAAGSGDEPQGDDLENAAGSAKGEDSTERETTAASSRGVLSGIGAEDPGEFGDRGNGGGLEIATFWTAGPGSPSERRGRPAWRDAASGVDRGSRRQNSFDAAVPVAEVVAQAAPLPLDAASGIDAAEWAPLDVADSALASRRAHPLAGVANVSASFDPQMLFRAVDALVETADSSPAPARVLAGAAVVVALGFSTTQIAWLLRGSLLLSKAAGSAPLWFSFDPLPILNALPAERDTDGETLADIADAGGGEGRR